jgi:two-component system sensor histidine kinase DegS
MYLEHRPVMTLEEMRNDEGLRRIVVQPVGTTGYTTLIDPVETVIIIHKFPGQEKDISPLKDSLPSFWELIETSIGSSETSGYYDWQEVDGTISQKYASIASVKNAGGVTLTLWATTYIDEFSTPAKETAEEINTAIIESGNYINNSVTQIQNIFVIVFTALVIVIIGLSLLLSRVITSPILALKRGAEAIGQGKLDYKLNVKNQDELGDLANSFNNMSLDIKKYIKELEDITIEKIAQEKRMHDNLRLYSQKVGEAQEAERKHIARELHDDTVQALVVVSRHLDDLALGDTSLTISDIRKEVQKVSEGVRNFSQQLRLSVLDDLGLVPAVQWLASDLTGNYGINVSTEITGKPRSLPPATELMLFRIIQEALTNVRKHAQATNVSVKIDFSDHNIRVTVQDNGKGFVMPKAIGDLTRTGRLGLAGMQERVELLGGSLNIQSEPGKGFTLTIEVPS